jgi:hypothetical protein
MVGEFDKVIDQIEFLLERPGVMTIQILKIHPVWEPLHNHPRFQKLMESDK